MTGQMAISVKLFGILRDHLPADAERGQVGILVPAGMDAAGILARFGLSAETVGHLVVLVNGRQVRPDHVLREGDVLSAFPALAGG
jgi:molybdopterin converting factor small subunit